MQHMVGVAGFPDIARITTESGYIGARGDRVIGLLGWKMVGGGFETGKGVEFGGGFAVQMTDGGGRCDGGHDITVLRRLWRAICQMHISADGPCTI